VIKTIAVLVVSIIIFSCADQPSSSTQQANSITGTWKLFSGTTIVKADSTVTDYTKDQEMIKIINDSHFAFFRHDLNKEKDSVKAIYSSGGGRYTLAGDQYTEQLDYCDAREWEGHVFNFTVNVKGDTLIQKGVEKLENLGIDRVIIEKYIRVKK
jgi:lipopolysaccharide export system protein LptA